MDLKEFVLQKVWGEARMVPFAWMSIALLWVIVWMSYAYAWPSVEQSALLNSRVERIEVRTVEEQLLQTKIRHCSAETQEAKYFFAERMQELVREYSRLTGNTYAGPSCYDLVGGPSG